MNTEWIGAWVRAARRHWNHSQEDLGDAMGLTKGNISAWENNRHSPSIQQLTRVSEITGFPMPEEILQHYPGGSKAPLVLHKEEAKPDSLSQQAMEIAKAFDSLQNPAQKMAVIMQLRAFGVLRG